MFNLFRKKEEKPAVDTTSGHLNLEVGSLLCPKCQIIMNKIIYKNIVMDVCPKCNSKFLDDGELEKIEGFKDFKI